MKDSEASESQIADARAAALRRAMEEDHVSPDGTSDLATRERLRLELRGRFGELYDELVDLLFSLDPMGVNYESNTDEYDPEVRTILPRLPDCRSVEDVDAVLGEEFQRWFDGGYGKVQWERRGETASVAVWSWWNGRANEPRV